MKEAPQSARPSAEGIYRRVSVRMYGDEKFSRLSPLLPSGQALWIYLLTGPHTGAVPGVFVIGRAALAEILGWEDEAFAKAFAEVFGEGLIEFDAKSRLWFIPNAIRHNMPANPNVVRSWRTHLAMLPECGIRSRIFDHLREVLFTMSEAFGKAFDEVVGKPFDAVPSKPSRKHSAKQEAGSRKQEKENPLPPAGPDEVEMRFTSFWAAYPRKVDRVAALKAFTKLRVDEALLATILVAIDRHKRSVQWVKDDGKFVPYPATWLNGARWNDEIDPVDAGDNRPAWATRAGFANRFEAENAGCFERNAGAFSNGKRLEPV